MKLNLRIFFANTIYTTKKGELQSVEGVLSADMMYAYTEDELNEIRDKIDANTNLA